MRFLRNSCTNAHYNMAFDQFCLEELEVDEPVFFLWQNAPAVIIGLNQNAYAEVNLSYLKQEGILLARRVTGGGAVYHDLGNLNYTIVGRSTDLERDYPGYLTYVIEALRRLGVPAELSGRNDIHVEGRKVSGYAKRVWKDRLMVHGTLMYDVDLTTLARALAVSTDKLEAHGIASVRSRVANLKDYLPSLPTVTALQEALEEILSRHYADSEVKLTPAQLERIGEIARSRFATWEWNIGRSPMTTFTRTRRFSCGTIEVCFAVEKGMLTALTFGGDFLGNRPADELARCLIDCRYERDALAARLGTLAVADYFDRLTPTELLTLLVGEDNRLENNE